MSNKSLKSECQKVRMSEQCRIIYNCAKHTLFGFSEIGKLGFFLFGFWILMLGFSAEALDGIDGKFKISTQPLGKAAATRFKGDLSNNLSIGFVKAGSVEVGTLSWRPNLKSGPWGLGIDVNVPLGNNRPTGYESFVFRYAEYNDGQKGLRYGVLDRVTWGHGLLVKNYSTRVSGPLVLNNNQLGLMGYYNFDRYGVQVLNTWSHIYGVRFTERVHPMLILGQGYISDADGVNVKQTNGTTMAYPSQAGFELDATVPLPYGFNGYAEYAQLNNFGKGASVGIDWGVDMLVFAATFDVGYRFLGANFVPGFFNIDYEIDPTNLVSVGASSKNGYYAQFMGIMSDYLKLQIMYESYQGANTSLMAQADSKPREDIFLSAYYKQPNFVNFKSLSLEQGAVMGAKVGYKVNSYTTVVTHYKKAYDPTLGKVVETQFYEIELSF